MPAGAASRPGRVGAMAGGLGQRRPRGGGPRRRPAPSAPPARPRSRPAPRHGGAQHRPLRPRPTVAPLLTPNRLQIPAIGVDAPGRPGRTGPRRRDGGPTGGRGRLVPARPAARCARDPRCSPATSTSTASGAPSSPSARSRSAPRSSSAGDLTARRYVVTAQDQIPKAEVELGALLHPRRTQPDHAHHLWGRVRPGRRPLHGQHHRHGGTRRSLTRRRFVSPWPERRTCHRSALKRASASARSVA